MNYFIIRVVNVSSLKIAEILLDQNHINGKAQSDNVTK